MPIETNRRGTVQHAMIAADSQFMVFQCDAEGISAATKQPVRTLFITSDASAVAGVGPCLADALERIDRSAIDPFVICPWEDKGAPTILPRLQALDLPLFTRDLGKWLPSPVNYGLRHLLQFGRTLKGRVWSIASLIERENIDLVYSNGLPCIDGALAARFTGRPHVWHLHEAVRGNTDLRRYIPARWVEALVARLSNVIIVNSSYLAREFQAAGRRTTICVVHNGVDLNEVAPELFPGAASAVRHELGLQPDVRIVLAVGTVAPRKGYDTLMRAAAQVLAHLPETVFLVAGAQTLDHTEDLKLLAARLGLGEAFRFLGPRQDVPILLAAANVVVHSAQQETFGRVLVEAMASCKPVVATRCGGPEEIVVDGETGYLVPIGADERMADRILALLGDAPTAIAMGQAGHRRATECFSSARYADAVQSIILSVGRKP